MKKLALFTALLLSFSHTHGALSAFSQGMKEIREILDSSYLRENLSQGSPISEIKLQQDDGQTRIYSVSAGEITLYAKLTYVKTARCGPRCYEIEWTNSSS